MANELKKKTKIIKIKTQRQNTNWLCAKLFHSTNRQNNYFHIQQRFLSIYCRHFPMIYHTVQWQYFVVESGNKTGSTAPLSHTDNCVALLRVKNIFHMEQCYKLTIFGNCRSHAISTFGFFFFLFRRHKIERKKKFVCHREIYLI